MPTPNFEDAPDGSSSINHTGSTFSAGDMTDMYNAAVRSPVNFEITENPFLPAPIPPPNQNTARPSRRLPRLRGASDPDAAIRKDPNAWSMREAVELCKLLEVVLPEAGFHIALTGGLLCKEGKQRDCNLLFYQIRGAEPNYEVLWKYLTVAGVIRHPEDSYNGWLVRATYRGKAIDCLFPNAGKKKKGAGPPLPPIRVIPEAPIPVRQSVYRLCNPAELLANPAPTPIPPPSPGLLSETERRLEDAEAVRTTREEF